MTCKICGTELVCFDRYEHGGPKPGCPKCGKLDEEIQRLLGYPECCIQSSVTSPKKVKTDG